jgi:hypothetical protein
MLFHVTLCDVQFKTTAFLDETIVSSFMKLITWNCVSSVYDPPKILARIYDSLLLAVFSYECENGLLLRGANINYKCVKINEAT